jgi:hypothetical protein
MMAAGINLVSWIDGSEGHPGSPPCWIAELMGVTNPSGWSGVLKVKTPAGATAGYILLYSNP